MTTRIGTDAPLVLLVPDALASTRAGEVLVDMTGLPPSGGATTDDVRNVSDIDGATLTDALDDADARLAALESFDAAGLGRPQVVTVRSASDFPAAVAGVRTLADDTLYWVVAGVNLGTDVLVSGSRCALFGIGASQSQVRTAAASPLVSGRSLLVRDIALINVGGPCVRAAGVSPADAAAVLRLNGCVVSGNSASGVVQAHDLSLFAAMFCQWRSCSGIGLRVTGTCTSSYVGASTVLGNGAGMVWLDVPAATTIGQRVLVDSVEFDLASGGVGIRADPAAFSDESLHVESCLFPAPSTPGIGQPIQLVTADSPECHFAANNNLENTHLRGGISIANNATATSVTDSISYFKLAGTTTLNESVLFDMPAPGTLRFVGTGPARVKAICYVTLVTAAPNQNLEILFCLTPAGGSPTNLTAFVQEDVTDGATLRTGIMPLMAWLTMNPGDAIDVRVRNKTAANSVTWRHGQVYAEQING